MQDCVADSGDVAAPIDLAVQLAAESAPGVLAYLSQPALIDDPDRRLAAFSAVATYVNSRYTADGSNSVTCSSSAGATPLSPGDLGGEPPSKWPWAEVLMLGVTDPWSRIRLVSLSPMADLVLAEVSRAMLRNGGADGRWLRHSPTSLERVPLSAPVSPGVSATRTVRAAASFFPSPCTALSMTPRRRRSALESRSVGSAVMVPMESVSAPLNYLWDWWTSATRWYEHDGIVRLLAKVYGRRRGLATATLRGDEEGVSAVLHTVVYPALADPQLPVRESAATLLGVLVDQGYPAVMPPTISADVVAHVTRTLETASRPEELNSPLTTANQQTARVLEGHLLALSVLVDMEAADVANPEVMPLLLRLASYPASSVRQYIAEILRPPAPTVLLYLLDRLREYDGQPVSKGTGEETFSWERLETIMMALYRHFQYLSATPVTALELYRGSPHTVMMLSSSFLEAPMSVTFQAMHSDRFEVARMGHQLFPLFLQLCTRFAAPSELPMVCKFCCGVDGCVQRDLRQLQASGDVAALARSQQAAATEVMPALWFYLVLRRISAEEGGVRLASPVSGAPGESLFAVEEAVRPYATVECVLAASTVAGAAAPSLDAAASPIALLVLAAYYARVMEPAEWGRCVDAVLKPRWWADLLSNPVRREHVRFGPDFFRAVRRCGTEQQTRRVLELIPTLTAALGGAQTHQQCLLLSMIRMAVSPSLVADSKAMSYIYHDTYVAPALTEGGEATVLGHTWLQQFAPTQDAVPTFLFWGTPETEAVRVVIQPDSPVYHAIVSNCFEETFQSTKTEPAVLRQTRTLMFTLVGLTTADVNWYALSLESIFARLDNLSPRWRESATASASDSVATPTPEEEEEEQEEMCWDDWDDDEEDADGAALGIYEAVAVKIATATVTTLRETVAGLADARGCVEETDKRFATELATLKVK